MNIYKRKKFISRFKVDYTRLKIVECPNIIMPFSGEYDEKNSLFKAYFNKCDCDRCKYSKKCIKEDFNNSYYELIIKEDISKKNMNYEDVKSVEKNETDKINKEKELIKDFLINQDGWKYVGNDNEVIIPRKIDGKIINEIPKEAFAGKRVKKVVLPNTIKVIGRSAFADCSELTEIVIPDSVTNIEAWAFGTCSSLRRIELSDNVVEIGSHAFDECYNLEHIKLPEEINYIGAYAFCETGLKKIVLPNAIKYLANSLFYECRYLSEVILQDGLETIGNYTFGNCTNLKKINLPDSIKQIAYAAFGGCANLASIRIPKCLNEMDETSFSNCSSLLRVETNDVTRKIAKFNVQNQTANAFGMEGNGTKHITDYDTIYNLLRGNTNKTIKVMPINENEVRYQEKYEDILNDGVCFKREGKYEEAKDKYIQAIRMGCKNPMAYYNLGKILYILGDFEASARSYRTSFELGIDPYNVLIHLGHSLLDLNSKSNKFESIILLYESGINPHMLKKYANDLDKFSKMIKNRPTKELLDVYENKCIEASKKYLMI